MLFSGLLSLQLDPIELVEGQEIVLFRYASAGGQFEQLEIDAYECQVQGSLLYSSTQLIFTVDSLECPSTARSSPFTLV